MATSSKPQPPRPPRPKFDVPNPVTGSDGKDMDVRNPVTGGKSGK